MIGLAKPIAAQKQESNPPTSSVVHHHDISHHHTRVLEAAYAYWYKELYGPRINNCNYGNES